MSQLNHKGQRARAGQRVRYRLDADDDPRSVERGLAALVLTVVELLRQLMERQALRRVAGGTVTDDQAERLGYALMRLEERMNELLDEFGLEPEDLNIDLGPLGPLLDKRLFRRGFALSARLVPRLCRMRKKRACEVMPPSSRRSRLAPVLAVLAPGRVSG